MNKKEKIDEAYEEYVQLRYQGATHEAAIKQFDYMHPVQLSRLEKRIKDTFKENDSQAV